MRAIDPGLSVCEVVLEHPESVSVFRRHRMDYCCGGWTTLSEASRERAVPLERLLVELEQAALLRPSDDGDPRGLSTPELVERIVERHHAYLRRELPEVDALADEVARLHGPRAPELLALALAVRQLAEVMLPHLDDEERALFPALGAHPLLAAAAHALGQMREEHRVVGELLHELRAFAADFVAPAWACPSHRALFARLERLEEDVMAHVHLENNVLAPRFL